MNISYREALMMGVWEFQTRLKGMGERRKVDLLQTGMIGSWIFKAFGGAKVSPHELVGLPTPKGKQVQRKSKDERIAIVGKAMKTWGKQHLN